MNRKIFIATILGMALMGTTASVEATAAQPAQAVAMAADNPFFQPWDTPFGVPPFQAVRTEHFEPAFLAAFAAHRAEIDAIAANPEPPTFANTIEAMERAGDLLDRVGRVFHYLASSHTSDALQAVERRIAPLEAQHGNALYLNAALFARIRSVHDQRDAAGLTPEQKRLVERYHTRFVRAGATLEGEARVRLAAITERLADLYTGFSQNVMGDEKAWTLALAGEQDLAGLPDFARTAAIQAGRERGLEGPVITLQRSSIEPFLVFSTRRDLREVAFKAWINRGANGDARDNMALIREIVALRQERAGLLGYESFAHFRTADTMAGSPEAVAGLLGQVWTAAKTRAAEERDLLQEMARAEGMNGAIAPWDWRHFAEKVRIARYDLDETAVKPYLQLDNMIQAAFDTATRLFGLTFHPRTDLPVYHPDVRVWEVKGRDGATVGLFYGDYFARPSKRSGAWMSALRSQEKLDGAVIPVITNNCNFSKGAEGEPALLSYDDAETLFHEFGHALHGLLSDVTYPSLAGTAVDRDFVELPSQIYEHWLSQPAVLGKFAVHYRTGQPMPADLADRLLKARTFNQGFATVEYVASALVDLEYHLLKEADGLDPAAFEAEVLKKIGMPAEIVMRHGSPHFLHIFSGEGYAAGYYSYMWAEVLDADGFEAFRQAGDPFDPAVAERLHRHIYAAGNSADPMELYKAFRGHAPDTTPLLRNRGLLN